MAVRQQRRRRSCWTNKARNDSNSFHSPQVSPSTLPTRPGRRIAWGRGVRGVESMRGLAGSRKGGRGSERKGRGSSTQSSVPASLTLLFFFAFLFLDCVCDPQGATAAPQSAEKPGNLTFFLFFLTVKSRNLLRRFAVVIFYFLNFPPQRSGCSAAAATRSETQVEDAAVARQHVHTVSRLTAALPFPPQIFHPVRLTRRCHSMIY